MPQLDHPSLHAEPPHNVMPPKSNTIRRHLPATVEGGATYSLISYETPDVRAHSISHWRLLLEHKRPRWLREMVAEAFGVFSFVYSGVGANASFAVQETNEPGKIFTIGLAFALSLAFAVIVAGHVSGGHFNPAITLSFAIFRNFPWKKVPRYILAQTVGAFVAAVLVFAQYHQKIVEFENRVKASGGSFVTSSGPAGRIQLRIII
ncbi:putative membrane protein [Neolecta irregularis DAH-3]|uniref:Putative membrane protein n=1 Tax=Neolecta irregularis (strain DAH-3) TaxID=1198029 RepID=A0A1U7LUA4_NEOID|nr:putative membrane protein [Neolecta irregularis DAH-3]|eukprot:OLL26256.1 putative membrane protein [Neolecta irregularis DAH-3]